MDTAQPMYEWNSLPWKTIERQVFKLQKRIYQAAQRGNKPLVHKLQRLLMKSWAARCLAVRQVTQDNQGKKTAGVDGVKALTPKQRLALVDTLSLAQPVQPVRRVWIPKPGTQEQRPLGIPVMHDRAAQALVKMALEPEWEAQFEPNSYGFRPGRAAHDAVEAIFKSIKYLPKYVLDADIAKCFDRISHQALLDKLATFPTMRRTIKAWLKAGVMEGAELFPTTEGTPQGGVVSPLLANIALHGLENHLTVAFPIKVKQNGVDLFWKPTVIRYADDFVVLHRDLAVIQQIQQMATDWLKNMGLELKASKTRITHTLNAHEGQPGFDFLGFEIRQYPVGKTHAWTTTGIVQKPMHFKTLIKPSKTAIHRHYATIAATIDKLQNAPQEALVSQLNPKIRGWCNYYATVVAKQVFSKMDHLVCQKLLRWANRRHHNKARSWIVKKYFNLGRTKLRNKQQWTFTTYNGMWLLIYAETPIRRYTKVQGTRSPLDGDWVYWATRMGRYPQVSPRRAYLLKRQHGKCAYCGLYFKDGEGMLEIDHIIPRSKGGQDNKANWQLLHIHCHDAKTATDKVKVGGIHDKNPVVEEPDELETLMSGFADEMGGRPTILV